MLQKSSRHWNTVSGVCSDNHQYNLYPLHTRFFHPPAVNAHSGFVRCRRQSFYLAQPHPDYLIRTPILTPSLLSSQYTYQEGISYVLFASAAVSTVFRLPVDYITNDTVNGRFFTNQRNIVPSSATPGRDGWRYFIGTSIPRVDAMILIFSA